MGTSSDILTNPAPPAGNAAPVTLLLIGFIAAFGAGKIPPVLPQIQAELSISLVQAGILVSSFQLAGALIGILAGALADRFGPRNLMMAGLAALVIGSIFGGLSGTASLLLASRAIESLGFTLSTLPGPALLRSIVPHDKLSRWLGLWGTYMPAGFALALIITPAMATEAGWRSAWFLHAIVALVAIVFLRMHVPGTPKPVNHAGTTAQSAFRSVVMLTMRSDGPWLCAIVFACYGGAYLSIVAFLPTIYQQTGLSPQTTGWLTALVAAINISGNIASGQLIHRGIAAHQLIVVAAVYLLVGSWLTYAANLSFLLTYLAVLSVSAVMGLIPGSLFYLVNRYAPASSAVSASVGLMQQGSAVGQLSMPVLVAAIATRSGGWQNTWWVMAAVTLVIVLVALLMRRKEQALNQQADLIS